MNIQQYLDRIGYTGNTSPTLETLRELHNVHFMSVPFENLDIHHDNPIVLDMEKIFEKVVGRNRGGFCYELNGLFHELLKSFGFEVKRISARVYDSQTPNPSIAEGGKGYGPEFDHLANIVRLPEGEYLADVGFGGFAGFPLKVELDLVQVDDTGNYRIEQHNDTYLQVSKETDGVWGPKYIFTLQEREFQEYAAMCHYMQTSPESHFTQKKMCTLPVPGGRITLSGDTITISTKEGKEEIKLQDEADYHEALKKYFRINAEEL